MQQTATASPLTTDDLDVLTADLARQVRDGELDERDARMSIYEAVFRTDLIGSETLRWCRRHNIPGHLHEEMVEAATEFYTRKILDLPTDPDAAGPDGRPADSTGRNGTKFFDLEHFLGGASAAGSIRQALGDYTLMYRTLYRSVNRVRRNGQVITSSDLLEGNLDAENPLAGYQHELPVAEDAAVAHVLDAGRSDRLERLHDQHRSSVNGQRGAVRTHIDAAVLRAAFDLPELERPLDPEVRTRLLARITEDETLAHRSLLALHARGADPRADDLGTVWAAFRDEHLEAILEQRLAREIAHLLAVDVLADRPRPGKPIIARLRSVVRRSVAGRGLDTQWAARLVATFLDHEHEVRSAWDAEGADDAPARDTDRYLAALGEAASLSGSPLGESPAAVRRTLEGLLEQARRPRA